MSNPTVLPVTTDDYQSQQALHQTEDAANKLAAQYFGTEILPYLDIDGEIDHIGSTELTHVEIKKYYQDFNYVMKDGSWTHLEFQSRDEGEKDLKRFRAYEALTSHQNDVDVKTYVLYSGNIQNPVTELHTGFNTYYVKPIIMKGHRAEEVFDNITYKLEHKEPLTKEDIVPLTLCPLMGGDIPQKERILRAVDIVKQVQHTIANADVIEAVLYAMANKFLNETDMNEVKEAIKMSPLGTMIYNDGVADGKAQGQELGMELGKELGMKLGMERGMEQGIEQGIEQTSIDNARNFLINGVSLEIVRNSIQNISDEELERIYNEVKAIKKQ